MPKKMDIPFNVNDEVKFKPRPAAILALRGHYDGLKLNPDHYMPRIDAGGFMTMPLWEFMNLLGPHTYMGPPTPFDTEIVLLGAEVPDA